MVTYAYPVLRGSTRFDMPLKIRQKFRRCPKFFLTLPTYSRLIYLRLKKKKIEFAFIFCELWLLEVGQNFSFFFFLFIFSISAIAQWCINTNLFNFLRVNLGNVPLYWLLICYVFWCHWLPASFRVRGTFFAISIGS